MLFGLSAALTKPTLDYLHESVGTMLSHWEPYALAIAGVLGFLLQQVSLGTGRLAPSVATVSVANPIVSVILGALLLDERLERPLWHVVVAFVGLGLALAGAVVISLAHERGRTRRPLPEPASPRSRSLDPTCLPPSKRSPSATSGSEERHRGERPRPRRGSLDRGRLRAVA